jgi:hypothetical protein
MKVSGERFTYKLIACILSIKGIRLLFRLKACNAYTLEECNKMITKNIGYAYATSPIAKKMKMSGTGCWFLALYDDSKPMSVKDVIMAATNKEAVICAAEQYNAPYGTYSITLVTGV